MALAKKPGETTTLDRAGPFDLTAMQMMADKIPQLQEFMNKNLKQGVKADWEYAHTIWKRQLKKDEEPKAALLDPGVAKIMNFMVMRPRHKLERREIDTKTNNLTYIMYSEIVPYLPVMYHNPITNVMEEKYPVVAEGVGSATTREKRYRVTFEYFKERDLKAQGWTEEEFEKFKADNSPDFVKGEAPTRLFYLPTAESLGADNTLLKMASKRAEMDAVFQLPGVAGRFSQEVDLLPDRGEEKITEPPVTPLTSTKLLMDAPKQEESKPVEKPDLKSVDINDPVGKIIADIQAVNKGLSRAQILAKMAEEKEKAAGMLTDEADAHLVASNYIPSTGFKSASELPKVPDDFRPCEEAAHIIDYIVENYSQQPETVRALVYREMNAAEPHLTDVEAAKAVQASFEERSQPADDDESEADTVYNAIQRAALDGEIIEVVSPGCLKTRKKKGSEKREFLGDRWYDYSNVLGKLGYGWVKDGENSHWKKGQ